MGPKKEVPGMAPPTLVPTARVPADVGGLPSPKPLQHYSCKSRGSRFLKMDNPMIAEAVSSFSVPLASSRVELGLADPSSKLMDGEEKDDDFWGVEDDVCWGGDEEDGDLTFWIGICWGSLVRSLLWLPLRRLRVERSF
jgi:hypothetical protein